MTSLGHGPWSPLAPESVSSFDCSRLSTALTIIIYTVVSCIVQLFFVYRIWKLSKKYTMPIIISVVTLAQCAFAIETGIIVRLPDADSFKSQ